MKILSSAWGKTTVPMSRPSTRSAGKGRIAPSDPGDAGKTERGQQQRQPGPLPGEMIEGFAAGVGRAREQQRGEADQDGPAHQREAAAKEE